MILNRRTILKTAIAGVLPTIPSWAIAQSLPKKRKPDWKPFVIFKGPAYHSVSLVVEAPDSMRWIAHTIQTTSTSQNPASQDHCAKAEILDSSWLPVKKNPTKWDMTQAWRPREDFLSDESFPRPIYKEYFTIGPDIRWIDAFDLVTQPFIPITKQLPQIGMKILLRYDFTWRKEFGEYDYRPVKVVDISTLPKGSRGWLFAQQGLIKEGFNYPEGISKGCESMIEWIELPPLSFDDKM